MTTIYEILEALEDARDNLKEVINTLRDQLKELDKMGFNGTEYYRHYVVNPLAILADDEHEFLSRDANIQKLINAVDDFEESDDYLIYMHEKAVDEGLEEV